MHLYIYIYIYTHIHIHILIHIYTYMPGLLHHRVHGALRAGEGPPRDDVRLRLPPAGYDIVYYIM